MSSVVLTTAWHLPFKQVLVGTPWTSKHHALALHFPNLDFGDGIFRCLLRANSHEACALLGAISL